MKLWVLSDLHVELAEFEPPAVDADVLVLAGDIDRADLVMEWIRAFFDIPAVFVSGNHEIYGFDHGEACALMRRRARELGVHYLDNNSVVIEAGGERVRFIGSTLWTDFELFSSPTKAELMALAERSIRDFHVITDGKGLLPFSPARTVELHQAARRFIATELSIPFDGKTVVVTHHCPSWQSVHPRYKDDLVAAAFASDLDYLVVKANLWIHGHTHHAVDARVGDDPERGRIVCNPRGYLRHTGNFENPDFNPGLVIEV